MKRRPNLLFLMTDHQRADSLGMTQCGVEVTPNLNRLARESVTFSRAYTTCPLCVPARTALACGKYPTGNGVVFNDWDGVRAGDHKPIHHYLAEAGYDVAHIGVDHIRVKPDLRQRLGFAAWVDPTDHGHYLEAAGLAPPDLEDYRTTIVENQDGSPIKTWYSNTRTGIWPHAAEHFQDSYYCAEAARFIHGNHDKPFALFVCLWAPHPPLVVPEPYASMFAVRDLVLPGNVGKAAEGEPANRRKGIAAQMAEGVSMDAWRRVWSAHLGLVRLADDGIGSVLQALGEAGHADSTITAFTVDHGDHLGQHNMYQKMEMYEQAMRVPLMFRARGCEAGSFNEPVSHLDVLPTLLDLVGLPMPSDIDGTSIAESIRSGSPPPEKTVFCQYSGNPTLGDTRRAAVTRRHKYIYGPADKPELYDLEDDPLEMENLAADETHGDVVRSLHRECAQWAENHGDWVTF